MIQILKFLLIRNFRESYSTRWVVVGEWLIILVSLLTYWYTARAFAPALDPHLPLFQPDYFSFLLVGETMLFVPLVLFEGPSRMIRNAVNEKTLDIYSLSLSGPQAVYSLASLMLIPREAIKISVTLLIAALFFHFQVPYQRSLAIGLGIMTGIPAFLGLGLVAAAVLVRFGRGGTVMNYFSSIATILAGAYFPITVLPETVQKGAQIFSPFTVYLDSLRRLFAFGWADTIAIQSLLRLLAVGVVLLIAGYVLLGMSFRFRLKRGDPLLLL